MSYEKRVRVLVTGIRGRTRQHLDHFIRAIPSSLSGELFKLMIDHLLQVLNSHKAGLPGRERVQFGFAGYALLARGARKAQRSADLATNLRERSLGACCGSPQTP